MLTLAVGCIRPEHGRRRASFLVRSGIAFAVWGTIATLPGAALPEIAASTSVSVAVIGLSFIPWSSGFLLGAFTAGRLAGHASRRRATSVASGLGTAGCTVLCCARYPALLHFGFLLLGVGCGLVFTSTHGFVGSLVEERRSRTLGMLDLAFSFGALVCPLAVQGLVHLGSGWRTAYAVLGLSQATLWLAATWNRSECNPLVPEEAVPKGLDQERPRLTRWYPGLACWTFFLGAVEWSQNTWLVDLGDHRLYGSDGGRLTLFAFAFGMVSGRLLVSLTSIPIRRFRFLIPLALAPASGLAVLLGTDRLDISCIAEAIVGGSVGTILPSFLGSMMDAAPALSARRSMVAMIMLTVGGQASTVAFAIGLRVTTYGYAFSLFELFSLALAVTLLMAAGDHERHRLRTGDEGNSLDRLSKR